MGTTCNLSHNLGFREVTVTPPNGTQFINQDSAIFIISDIWFTYTLTRIHGPCSKKKNFRSQRTSKLGIEILR